VLVYRTGEVVTIATDQGTIECTINRAADHGVGVEGVVLLGEPPLRGRPPHRQVLDILTRRRVSAGLASPLRARIRVEPEDRQGTILARPA
jgi:hypothetical protein